MTFMLWGCQQSTLNPNDVPNNIAKQLQSKTWDIQISVNNNGNVVDSSSGYILQLNSDGTYVQSCPFAPSQTGRWFVNEKDSTLKLVPNNNTQIEVAKLTIISNDTLGFVTKSGKSVISISKSSPIFSISGDIVFLKNIKIPANHRLSVVWQTSDTTVGYVWGEGKIDEFNKTFTINFPAYMPDEIIQHFVVCNDLSGGIGYIYLHSDNKIISGVTTLPYRRPQNTIGIVKDRALVYLFGMPLIENHESNSCLWNNSFSLGYNLALTPFGSQQQSFLSSKDFHNNQLVITDDISIFTQGVNWQVK